MQGEHVPVISCTSASQGLSLAKSLRPQAIVLGIAVPDDDAWNALVQLRSDIGLRSVPVIVASLLDEQARALVLGASAYVGKPIDRDHLLTVLAQVRAA
ncbi:response regulator [Nannocystis pusilla]|uniref:response regulator n=1 Tax=Nannocystis pusilla TaxID=889268 RepID=UPI003DA2F433